jgi:RNA polymerase sigma-70 factor (ECF subfamily)
VTARATGTALAPRTWERDVRARVVAGDDGALGEVYHQYSSFVYRLALRVTGDARAAEDVRQEVFVGFWQRPAAFDPARGTLRTWLGTLTQRRSVDHVRSEAARRRRVERAGPTMTPAVDVEEMAAALLAAARVRAALDTLPEPQRRAVQLAYFGGRTYRQVAQILAIPEGTAKSRLRAALQHIGRVLEADGDEW